MKWNRQSCTQNSVKHQQPSSSAKTANSLNMLTFSIKKLHHRPLTRLQVWIWRCCECGVWLDCHTWNLCRRLVNKEVADVGSNYKKSYFWWPGNPACVNSTGNNRTGKNQGHVSARLVWGTGREGALWLSAHGAPSAHWANDDYVDV